MAGEAYPPSLFSFFLLAFFIFDRNFFPSELRAIETYEVTKLAQSKLPTSKVSIEDMAANAQPT
jgi:hypothetical protein